MQARQDDSRTPNVQRDGAGADASPADGSQRERLYDLYMDAALAGQSEDPAIFLSRHGIEDNVLLGQLLAVYAASNEQRSRRGDNNEQADLNPPRALGEFTLLRKLGEGGMGVVFLAEQTSLGRQVALKIIRPEFARSATAAKRFDREAKAIARLHHPNIVTVHAVGEVKGVHYIAMELVPGRGLDEILRDEQLPTATVLRWIAEVADALHYAHEHDIVHRDVKPSNIRVQIERSEVRGQKSDDSDSRSLTSDLRPLTSSVKVVDFGLARDLSGDGATLTEAFVGSPFYVAPEQVGRRGGEVDGRTDVYSLGVVLYQCLTGRIPFSEGSLEQVLQQILTEDPPRLRSVNPSLPRELEIVVHKAMEKQPSQRYESAGALAADLRALIEYRPIAAHPPGVAARAMKWARRNVAAATAAGTAAIALLVLAAVLIGQQIAAHARQREEARTALADARSLVQLIGQSRTESERLEGQFEQLQSESNARYFSPEDDRRLNEAEDKVARVRKERERDFHRTLDLLARAERLGAPPHEVRHARGELYLARYLEATVSRDPVEMSMYRDLVKQNDPTGALAVELAGGSTLTLTTDPPGAELHVFRMVDLADVVPGGDHRMIPVPLNGMPPIEPGTLAMRVIDGPGDSTLRANDLVIEIDGRPVQNNDVIAAERGGVEATVLHDGALRAVTLPPGLSLRLTAAPLAIGAQSLIGRTPITDLQLEGGDYLALLRADGYADQRIALYIFRGSVTNLTIALERSDSSPTGFVRVINHRHGVVVPEVWIMEREVTVREYFEFLHDPETMAEIDASSETIRIPRSTIEGLHAPPGSDGRFTLGDELQWDWPVFGISWHDAQAYAQWKTRQARAAGRDEIYALPTLDEWVAAAGQCYGCMFVFGNHFRHKWVCSVYSIPKPDPQPVMKYPIDESCFGVYDMSGSLSEWLDSFWREEKGTYRHAGGSWAYGGPGSFQVYGGNGLPPEKFADTVGFRLVMRRMMP